MNLRNDRKLQRQFEREHANIVIWTARHPTNSSSDVLAWCDRVLSYDERVREEQLPHPTQRDAYRLARGLVRYALSASSRCVEPTSWILGSGERGRPIVKSPRLDDVDFSVTHCEGLVAVAVASLPGVNIGVDFEPLHRPAYDTGVVDAYFHPNEARYVRALESARSTRFLELWTLKEAYLKATGEGLSGLSRAPSFVVAGTVQETKEIREQAYVAAGCIRIRDTHQGAVVVRGGAGLPPLTIRFSEFDPTSLVVRACENIHLVDALALWPEDL